MEAVKTNKIRNICTMGNGGSGKTSLAEAILFLTKTTDRLGTPGAGNTVCDFDPEETKRGFSIFASCASLVHKDTKINLIDTPGSLDFVGEVLTALRVADSALIVVDAKSGIHVGTDLAWENATEAGIPRAFFINKCDEPGVNFDKLIAGLIETYGKTVCPVFVPTKTPGSFVNLFSQKVYTYATNGAYTVGEVAADFAETANAYREMLFEAIAMTNDELMEKFFAGIELTAEEAGDALGKGIADGSITPVFSGCATKLWGIEALLNNFASSFPSPVAKKTEKIKKGDEIATVDIKSEGDASVFVFKTSVDQYGRQSYFKVMSGILKNGATLKNSATGASEKFANFATVFGKKQTTADSLSCGDIGIITKLGNTNTGDTLCAGATVEYVRTKYPKPYYTMALVSKGKGDEDKIAQGIIKMSEEDRTLKFESNAETRQMLISGLGDMHLDVALSRLKTRNGVTVELKPPRTAYRETIKKRVQVEGKHKKQSGGSGQFGHVKITFSPGEADGLTFTTSVVGGSVPKGYFPAVEKGLLEAMNKGVLAGYPVINLAADLYDGSYHDVDSNELSFKLAASLAYKSGLPNAGPVLLEPVGQLNVTIPDDVMGGIIGDINGKRRGSVLGTNAVPGKRGYTTIEADIPKAEMADYSIALRAMTQGKGSFTFNVTRYEEVPANISQKIIADAKVEAEKEA